MHPIVYDTPRYYDHGLDHGDALTREQQWAGDKQEMRKKKRTAKRIGYEKFNYQLQRYYAKGRLGSQSQNVSLSPATHSR